MQKLPYDHPMPEGPEVKTVARTLAKEIVGHKLLKLWHSQHRLRQAVDYSLLRRMENAVVDGVSSYGKVLFISVD
ncbi:MAG TPA: DNA-formamidopyrimidine glycosylase family protein, partial [Myxococcota bacterium]|nr:DNA-formamidopyrimidine glycosylase family protein [Myxococcota bacterium]